LQSLQGKAVPEIADHSRFPMWIHGERSRRVQKTEEWFDLLHGKDLLEHFNEGRAGPYF
jgi:hypothetical protein